MELRGSLDEIIDGFELSHFGTSPTKYDVADLTPLTARVLSALPLEAVTGQLGELGVPEALQADFWDAIRENIAARSEIGDWWALCRDGASPLVDAEDAGFVAEAMGMLPDRPWDTETWSSWAGAVKTATGRKGKGLFMPLRKALTGRTNGPDMGKLMPLLQQVG